MFCYGDSHEVRAVIKLLRALSYPQDALALVSVLRGPLFGISDPELFAFKQAGGWFGLSVERRTRVLLAAPTTARADAPAIA